MIEFKRLQCGVVLLVFILCCGCTKQGPVVEPASEEETLARTEFTSRVENYFEYVPLKADKPSIFRIHLTDLTDGSPVSQAEVTIVARIAGSTQSVAEATAKIGKVTGIYVAELTLRQPGAYDLEFHVKNDKLDERMPLSGFKAE